MNIVLIGYRGSGKSAVGRELARMLAWPLVDTDVLIEQRAGKSIREIFIEEGEAAFRDIEARTVAEASALDGQVISAGGGAILRASNTAALKKHGKLVWLTASAEVLWGRICADASTAAMRPALTANGGLEEVRELLQRREPLYQAAADLVIDSSDAEPDRIAARIIHEFRLDSAGGGGRP